MLYLLTLNVPGNVCCGVLSITECRHLNLTKLFGAVALHNVAVLFFNEYCKITSQNTQAFLYNTL